MNSYSALGNLTRDPETHTFASGATVTKFGLAVNGRFVKKDGETVNDENGRPQREVVFWDCEAWGGTGDLVSKYLKKGEKVVLSGEVREESWTDKATEQKRSKKVFSVREVTFVNAPSGDGEEKKEKAAPKKGRPKKVETVVDDSSDGDGGEIPF